VASCGTRNGYATGCRCTECKAAQARYQREYRARKRGVDLPTRPPGRPRRGEEAVPLSPVAQVSGVAQCGERSQHKA